MDVFKQKWNQRMQQDPYVNFVLNSDEREIPGDPDRLEYYYFIPNKPRLMLPSIKEVDGQYYRKTRRKWTKKGLEAARDRQKRLPRGAQGIDYIYTDPIPLPTLLHDNTRPQSLYNLRYPSLR